MNTFRRKHRKFIVTLLNSLLKRPEKLLQLKVRTVEGILNIMVLALFCQVVIDVVTVEILGRFYAAFGWISAEMTESCWTTGNWKKITPIPCKSLHCIFLIFRWIFEEVYYWLNIIPTVVLNNLAGSLIIFFLNLVVLKLRWHWAQFARWQR